MPDGLIHKAIWKAVSVKCLEKASTLKKLKKYLPGDWINHLSITAYSRLTLTNQQLSDIKRADDFKKKGTQPDDLCNLASSQYN